MDGYLLCLEVDAEGAKCAGTVRADTRDTLKVWHALELEVLAATTLRGPDPRVDVTGFSADDNGAFGAQSNVLSDNQQCHIERLGIPLTFTALNFLRSAHTRCGLNVVLECWLSFPSELSWGGEKVKTSPFDDRAAKRSPHEVTFAMCESLIA